jgi:protein-S-isoprenylcysteine O-methyltransferase Ste14
MLRSIIILPGTVVVFIPSVLVWLSRDSSSAAGLASPGQAVLWLGSLSFAVGLGLAIWTSRLFLQEGDGTPAPWDPPKKFVVLGPYRHVRNPMISGVLFMLLGEALLFQSSLNFGWMVLFFLANAIYLPNIEERDLEGRFGEPYREYKKHVRRRVPRISPWMAP